MRQKLFEAVPIVAGAGQNDVEHGRHSLLACGAEQFCQFHLLERRHEQIAADVKNLGAAHFVPRNVGRRELGVSAERVDEAAIFSLDVDDERGRRADAVETAD